MKENKFIIIGSGIAGISCMEALKDLISINDTITLISNSSVMKYVKKSLKVTPHIENFEIGETDWETYKMMEQKNQSISERLYILQSQVTQLDTKEQKVITKEGSFHHYDLLCICSGAKPKLILNHSNVIGIRDIDSLEVRNRREKKNERCFFKSCLGFVFPFEGS
jgi:NADH dehydrogenase FAD-containing subunit